MVDVNVIPFEIETATRHGDLVRADVTDTYHHDAQHRVPPPPARASSASAAVTRNTNMRTNRVVLITGAAGGMGAFFVERFLANGDTVIATDTSDEALAAARVRGFRPRTAGLCAS